MVEQVLYTDKVGGSNPSPPTPSRRNQEKSVYTKVYTGVEKSALFGTGRIPENRRKPLDCRRKGSNVQMGKNGLCCV